jgi:hypothetical protein
MDLPCAKTGMLELLLLTPFRGHVAQTQGEE